MRDDELTDAWEAGAVFPKGVSHWQHLRIAWVLHRRHGAADARRRLLGGTKRACEVHGCPEKFDAALTERWARAIADAAERDGLGPNAGHFFDAHPELRRSDLFGSPDRLVSPPESSRGVRPRCRRNDSKRQAQRFYSNADRERVPRREIVNDARVDRVEEQWGQRE